MASSYVRPNVTASGATWANLKGKGLSGHLDLLVAAQPQSGSPNPAPSAAATASATGGGTTGGSLQAGTYYLVVTESNGFGETTIGPESAQLTVGAGNIPQVTFQSLKSGNTARNLYVGAKNGPSGGPYTLYVRGVTAGTYNMSADLPTDSSAVAPPTANTTALSGRQVEMIRAIKAGNLEEAYRRAADVVQSFLQGDPVGHDTMLRHYREADAAMSLLYTLFGEVGTLLVANAGTLGTVATPIGGRTGFRTLP